MVDELHSQNPYLDAAGEAQLRRSVAVFVDILGYKETTRRAIESGNGQRFLRSLRETLSRAFAHLKITEDRWKGQPAPWAVKTFSDNIFIGYPISYQDGKVELSVVTRRFGGLPTGDDTEWLLHSWRGRGRRSVYGRPDGVRPRSSRRL